MLYLCWCFRQVHEPPLDIGWIPYVGRAVEFGRDAHGFLLQKKKKFGDVFTVLIAGLKTNLEHCVVSCWCVFYHRKPVNFRHGWIYSPKFQIYWLMVSTQ